MQNPIIQGMLNGYLHSFFIFYFEKNAFVEGAIKILLGWYVAFNRFVVFTRVK
jgi:hypothetical protein